MPHKPRHKPGRPAPSGKNKNGPESASVPTETKETATFSAPPTAKNPAPIKTFYSLPVHLVNKLLSYLPYDDVSSAMESCKLFRAGALYRPDAVDILPPIDFNCTVSATSVACSFEIFRARRPRLTGAYDLSEWTTDANTTGLQHKYGYVLGTNRLSKRFYDIYDCKAGLYQNFVKFLQKLQRKGRITDLTLNIKEESIHSFLSFLLFFARHPVNHLTLKNCEKTCKPASLLRCLKDKGLSTTLEIDGCDGVSEEFFKAVCRRQHVRQITVTAGTWFDAKFMGNMENISNCVVKGKNGITQEEVIEFFMDWIKTQDENPEEAMKKYMKHPINHVDGKDIVRFRDVILTSSFRYSILFKASLNAAASVMGFETHVSTDGEGHHRYAIVGKKAGINMGTIDTSLAMKEPVMFFTFFVRLTDEPWPLCYTLPLFIPAGVTGLPGLCPSAHRRNRML